jgi:hypothetical protein
VNTPSFSLKALYDTTQRLRKEKAMEKDDGSGN